MPSPYATIEDSVSLWYEQVNYLSTHISAIGYGIHVVICGVVTYYTITKRKLLRGWPVWLVFNTTLFIIGTINLACTIRFNEDAWINGRNYPGGPYAFILEQQSRPIITLGNTCSILTLCLANALLLYRMMVVWNFVWYIILIPTLFYFVSVAFSIMVVIQGAKPSLMSTLSLSLPVWLILMVINMILSAMIATRILMLRKRLVVALGKEHGKVYTSVASLIVEAALPYNILSIVLLGLFGSKATAQNLFVPLIVQVEYITPELIILWLILGRSLSRETCSSLQTHQGMHFAEPSPEGAPSAANRMRRGQGVSSSFGGALEYGDKERGMPNGIPPVLTLRTFNTHLISNYQLGIEQFEVYSSSFSR